MVLKQVVFANPNNLQAKNLLADSYEQMAYQSESGPWRLIYLQGATELRKGVPNTRARKSASRDILQAMSPDLIFDYWSVRLNAEKAENKKLKINFNFTDLAQQYTVSVENSVLNYSQHVHPKADVQVILTKDTFNQLQLGTVTWQEKIKSGDIKIVGNAEVLTQLKLMIDEYNFWFNIVTP